MQTSEAVSSAAKTGGDGRTVLRNTMYLGIAEVLSMPISLVLNGLIGRYLGPDDVGRIYLATTITSLAFLAVNWGHSGSLPAAVVRDRPNAGRLLGSSAAWRAVAALVVYGVVAGVGHLFGLDVRQQWALGLVFFAYGLQSIVSACQDVIRGFERTDVAAYSRVASQLFALVLVVPTLLLGGGMRLVLLMQAAAVLFVLFGVLRALRPTGVGEVGWDRGAYKALMREGTPFVFFGLALALQPNVDAFYLARLSNPEVVGWYAVSQKLIGFLIMPATALIGALYPTLCRLYMSDMEGFRRTTRSSISTVSLLVVPVALGTALYPDLGVSIFGREAFRPAEDTLRIAAFFLFLVYFSMPLGTAIVAAGRARAWTLIQLACVANSAVLDPFLIGYFQEHYGNGGLGLAIASSISEACMVLGGIALLPRGVFAAGLARTLGLSVLSGAAMVAAAFALRPLPSLVAAPLASAAYAVALYATGALDKQQLAELTGAVRRKLGRGKPATG